MNKVLPALSDVFRRVRQYCYQLENAQAQRACGIPGRIGKCVILSHEAVNGRITLVLINETPGY